MSCEKQFPILVRVWSLLRHGVDPKFRCTEVKLDRIAQELKQMNNIVQRKGKNGAFDR